MVMRLSQIEAFFFGIHINEKLKRHGLDNFHQHLTIKYISTIVLIDRVMQIYGHHRVTAINFSFDNKCSHVCVNQGLQHWKLQASYWFRFFLVICNTLWRMIMMNQNSATRGSAWDGLTFLLTHSCCIHLLKESKCYKSKISMPTEPVSWFAIYMSN